jgi:hypothetical protein
MDLRRYRNELTPFRPGDRVRCLIATADTLGGVELLGRLGVVIAAEARPSNGKRHPGWAITVDWRFGEPKIRTIHDPEELGIVLP